jgi:hypothetical protein
MSELFPGDGRRGNARAAIAVVALHPRLTKEIF